jgi:hypothetical protein
MKKKKKIFFSYKLSALNSAGTLSSALKTLCSTFILQALSQSAQHLLLMDPDLAGPKNMRIRIPNTGGEFGKVIPRFLNFYLSIIQVMDIHNDSPKFYKLSISYFFTKVSTRWVSFHDRFIQKYDEECRISVQVLLKKTVCSLWRAGGFSWSLEEFFTMDFYQILIQIRTLIFFYLSFSVNMWVMHLCYFVLCKIFVNPHAKKKSWSVYESAADFIEN